jgi:hypothetical protein
MTQSGTDIAEILRREVFIDGANVPFGALTFDDARARADALRAATGWGPTARVAPVAHASRELANAIHSSAASSAGELDPALLTGLALKRWPVLPNGD